jgi:diguanylate cyclase
VAGTQPQGRSAATPPSDALGIDDASVRATLAALLAEIRKDKVLAARSESLDAQLADTLTRERLSAVLTDMTELTGQRIQRLESEKHEIATLLSHMVDKLDEIGRFVAEQKCSQMKSHASSETLNDQLAGEMRAMGESVDAASDLQQLRMQVRTRIESIDKHVQHFRERETALAEEMRKRSEHMRGRIAELETRAQRLQHQLEDEQRLSTIDMLTRIPNRLAYEKRIDEEINRWQRFGQPACLAVWDVDRFKKINDTYGHRAGDRVLGAIAECLSNRLRSTDFVARYGGEEFVMILPGTTCDDAGRVVDELRVAVAQIGFHFRGTPVAVTISAGLTQLLPADSAGAAFDRADKALYLAKQSGRDRCVRG